MDILFAICLWTFLQVDADHLEDSAGATPSLSFRPKPRGGSGNMIRYQVDDPTSYQYLINDLAEFLIPYKYDAEHTEAYENVQVCNFKNPPMGGQVCDVDTTMWHPCTEAYGFGYNESMPCVFLHLNNINGWTPEFYESPEALPSEMPVDLREHIRSIVAGKEEKLNMTWVSCEGESLADKDNLGAVIYYPLRGFPGYYFPYTGQEGYRSPLVAILLEKPAKGVPIRIQCRAWARNIQYDRAQGRGSTTFEIMVE